MSRPSGDVRLALRAAAVALNASQGAATWCEMVALAQVGREAGHDAVRNMARHGELVRVGHHKRPGGGWVGLYQPAPALLARAGGDDVGALDAGADGQRWAPLAFVLGSWPAAVPGGA